MQISGSNIAIMRGALFAGALLFGVVSIVLNKNPEHVTLDPIALSKVRMAAYALIPAACVALIILSARRSAAPAAQRDTLTIVGWGVAEMSAVVGAVLIYVGGEMWAWLGGLAVMILSWQLLPADTQAE